MLKKIIKVLMFSTVFIFLFVIVILPKMHIFQKHMFRSHITEPIPASVEILALKRIIDAHAIQFSANTQDMEYIINSKETFSMDNLQIALDPRSFKLKAHTILLDKLNFPLDDNVTLYSNLSFIDEKVASQFQFVPPSLELLFVRENIAVYIRIKM